MTVKYNKAATRLAIKSCQPGAGIRKLTFEEELPRPY